ncbi:MAG: hypothetical protein IKT39_02590 [Clostridia bacterium]|nr:hypothetical protein [Clostridia bacterium]
MNKTRKITIEIETIRAGQPRPYADSEYEYILTVEGMNEGEVEYYCKTILRSCRNTYQTWSENKNDASVYFGGYYKFDKLEDGKYRYFKLEPFCD